MARRPADTATTLRMGVRTLRMGVRALTLGCLLVALASPAVASARRAAEPAQANLSRALTSGSSTGYSVSLEQCIPSAVQSERSATFTAEMIATSETQHMAVRIELQQRLKGEIGFHTLVAPGFGVWRSSESGVKIYKYVKQVTNLGAPAAYRAIVRFRWIGQKGRQIKRAELRTPRCSQPLLSEGVMQGTPTTPSS